MINMLKGYYNGNFISMTERKVEALVCQKDQIVYVGDLQEAKQKWKDVQWIDLNGKTLLPGFIDAHSHFFQMAQMIQMCDLSEASCFEEIQTKIKNYIDTNQIDKNGLVYAIGYDHNFLKEQKHPTKDLLDEISKEIPIYASHISSHMGVANSALLKLANVKDDIPQPEGGLFGKDEQGHLTGYIEEIPALMQIIPVCMQRFQFDLPNQIKEAQNLYFKYGITTAQEGAASYQTIQAIEKLKSLFQIDLVAYIMENEWDKVKISDTYSDHFRIGGLKMILDGSPQGKSAWLSKPYQGETSYCGYPSHEDSYVEKVCERAIQNSYQLLAHCNGDAASEQFIRCYQSAYEKAETKEEDLRPMMIHSQTVRCDQLDRMLPLHMIPSFFIGHVYYWGDIHIKNLGMERAEKISPVHSSLERGLIYNFHQDTPVTKPDMLHSVWCAVNRQTRLKKTLGKEECIDVYSALKGVTIHAAYAYHEEKQKGSLEEGKKADFVILDKNPLEVDSMEIKNIQVLETIKDGMTVYKKA